MTTAVRTLEARFDGSTTGLDRATNRAERNLRGFDRAADRATSSAGSSFAKFGRGLVAFTGVAAIATGALIGTGAALLSIGEDALKMRTGVDKARTIFGDSFSKIEAAAESTATQMGLTTREFQILAAGIGDFLVPMGFARSDAADLTLKFQQLSGVLSVWSAGTLTAADVSTLFQSAMAGEFDSLQRLGIQINAARVQREQEAIQLASNIPLTDDMARALAIEKITREDSTDALSFYNSEAGKAARVAEEQKTKLRELGQDIGEKLIPVYEDLWAWVEQKVVPALEDFVAWLDSDEGKEAMDAFAAQLEEIAGDLADVAAFIGDVIGALKATWGVLDTTGRKFDSFLDIAEQVDGRITTLRTAATILQNLPGGFGAFAFRQHGGDVMAGRPYIVGEHEAELFVPDQSGHIYPSVPGSFEGEFTGALYLDSGQFLGMVRGMISDHDRDLKRRAGAGTR